MCQKISLRNYDTAILVFESVSAIKVFVNVFGCTWNHAKDVKL